MAASQIKPGWKSTEFILSLLASLVSFLYASGVLEMTSTKWDNQAVGLIAMVLTSMGYAVSRGLAKKA